MTDTTTTTTDVSTRIKAVKKKLKQIDELEEKEEGGLTEEQLVKIGRRNDLVKELEELEGRR